MWIPIYSQWKDKQKNFFKFLMEKDNMVETTREWMLDFSKCTLLYNFDSENM